MTFCGSYIRPILTICAHYINLGQMGLKNTCAKSLRHHPGPRKLMSYGCINHIQTFHWWTWSRAATWTDASSHIGPSNYMEVVLKRYNHHVRLASYCCRWYPFRIHLAPWIRYREAFGCHITTISYNKHTSYATKVYYISSHAELARLQFLQLRYTVKS